MSAATSRRWKHRPTFAALACDVLVWGAWVGISVLVILAFCAALWVVS